MRRSRNQSQADSAWAYKFAKIEHLIMNALKQKDTVESINARLACSGAGLGNGLEGALFYNMYSIRTQLNDE